MLWERNNDRWIGKYACQTSTQRSVWNSTFLQSLQAKLSPTDLILIIKNGGTPRPVIRRIYGYVIV